MPLAFLLTMAGVVLLDVALKRINANWPGDTAQLAPGAASARTVLTLAWMSTVYGAARSLMLAPLAIAVHRFVLLGERARLLPLRPVSRVLRFAGWLILIGAMDNLVALSSLLPPWGGLAALMASIMVMVLTMRLVLVFPAVAVGSPGDTLRLGWRETRWQFWRIFAVLLASVLPVIAALGLLLVLYHQLDPGVTLQAAAGMPLLSASDPLFTGLGAAAASWMFLAYTGDPRARRSERPASPWE